MKNTIFTLAFIALFFGVFSSVSAQKDAGVRITSGKVAGFVLFESQISFNLSLDGKLTGFDAACSGEISYDLNDRISKIGSNSVLYDLNDRIVKIGSVSVDYDLEGRVRRIGARNVSYNLNNSIRSIGEINISYDLNDRINRFS
jgi:hypothetical protein